jgi:ABC-2 type transport system permease protein
VSTLAPPPIRHLIRAYMTEARYELLRTLRAPAFAGPFLLILTALGRAPVTVAQAAGVAITCVVGTLPFCAIGLFIGARVSGRAAPAFVNLAYLPPMYLSGLFFPVPQAIRWVALFSPAFHLNQLALHAAGTPSILGPAINIAALIGVTVLFTGLTARRLSRGMS